MLFIKIRKFPYIASLLRVFIMNECLILLNAFSASIVLSGDYSTLACWYDFKYFTFTSWNTPHLVMMYILLFINCRIRFAKIFWRFLCLSLWVMLFYSFLFTLLWSGLGIIILSSKWVRKYFVLFNFLKEFLYISAKTQRILKLEGTVEITDYLLGPWFDYRDTSVCVCVCVCVCVLVA